MLYVCGIKSPGLSAAPAIADYALEKLKEMGACSRKENHVERQAYANTFPKAF